MRRMAALVLLAALWATPAPAIDDPSEMLADHRQEARAEAIGSRLRCLVCQNESIEDSGAALARDLRHVVRVHVAAGESDRQIMDWMVVRYGDFIRLQPRLGMATLLLWGMPVLALVIGGLAAWIGLRRTPVAPAPLLPEERVRLEELLR